MDATSNHIFFCRIAALHFAVRRLIPGEPAGSPPTRAELGMALDLADLAAELVQQRQQGLEQDQGLEQEQWLELEQELEKLQDLEKLVELEQLLEEEQELKLELERIASESGRLQVLCYDLLAEMCSGVVEEINR